MDKIHDWKIYYRKMVESGKLSIDYPICGGGEECITACPKGDKIWKVVPMEVSLMGIKKKTRMRPFMVRPELCEGCNICVQACPTGALRPASKPVKSRVVTVFVNTVKLPFKKKYNAKFVFREEHKAAFLKNNGFKEHGNGS
jgi:NAD-dependent dihydropyrimidine dehydrogenase PreA subunit